jgi:ribosomal-protein-alanine N-acetyltransferase
MSSINAPKPLSYSISRATKNDIKSLTVLENLVFKPSDGILSPRAFRYHIQAQKNLLLVAKIEEPHCQLIGYILVLIYRLSARVYSLAIDPGYRNQRIGSTLLEAAIEEIKKKGLLKISLELRKKNKAAMRLYKLFGFEVSGFCPGYYQGEDDAVVMMRKLDG